MFQGLSATSKVIFKIIYAISHFLHDHLRFLSTWVVQSLSVTLAVTLIIYAPRIISTTLSSTTPALSPTCVAIRYCAIPIQASSGASLSSLFSASSVSVLPISFFPNFSKHRSIICIKFVEWVLTCCGFFDLLRCDREDREYLRHYLHNYIHHFRTRLHFCVDLDTSKDVFYSLEYVDKSVVTCSSILNCLMDLYVTTAPAILFRIHTDRSTPTPAKIMVVGEITS